MKKIAVIFLLAALLVPAFAGCGTGGGAETVIFIGVVEEVQENSILVIADDQVQFERAVVYYAEDLRLDFDPQQGQVLEIEILPEIRESYPVQVIAVGIERK